MNRSEYRVIYGDTDQMGVVYYANYLAFFERGRCEFMRERRFDYGKLEKEGFALPVVDVACKYRAPARFDDLLTIESRITAASRITIAFSYRILRDDALLAEGSTTHACLKQGRPARLPSVVKDLLPPELLAPAGLT